MIQFIANKHETETDMENEKIALYYGRLDGLQVRDWRERGREKERERGR